MKLTRRKNPREQAVIAEYQGKGYLVLAKGWPDLLLVKGDDIFAIEVKRKQRRATVKGGLTEAQRRVHEILRRIGLRVEVRYEAGPVRVRRTLGLHSPRQKARVR